MSSLFVAIGRRLRLPPILRLARITMPLVVVLVVLCSKNGSGQTVMVQGSPPSRPIQTNPNVQPGHGLNLSASIFEAYDRNQVFGGVQVATAPVVTPVYRRNGARTGGDVSLSYGYSRQWRRAAFGVSARTAANIYSVHRDPLYTTGAGAYARVPLGRRTNFTATQTFSYAPYYNLGLFPGVAGTVDPADLASTVDPNISLAVYPSRMYLYGTSAAISRQFSLRNAVSVSYDQHYSDFRGAQPDRRDYTARATFSRQLSRDLGMHLGYGYGAGSYQATNTGKPVTHNIDVGVDYHKALSLSRRTSFSFSTGSAILAHGAAASSPVSAPAFNHKTFDLTGTANLDHEIGRTWSARLSYRRGWQFVDGFSSMFFVDGVTAGIGGSTGRRTTLAATTSYAHASVGAGGQDAHDGYFSSATYRIRITRWSSGYAQYSYYRYNFPNGTAALPVGFPQSLDRHTARVGLSMSVPLLR